jgi:hypothetical protein
MELALLNAFKHLSPGSLAVQMANDAAMRTAYARLCPTA